jgi:hypothetical protein
VCAADALQINHGGTENTEEDSILNAKRPTQTTDN